jgi:hypothetical protein
MEAKQRLEELRTELRNETISQLELMELESLAEEIEEGDVELLEAAGVPEDLEERAEFFRKRAGLHSPTPWCCYSDKTFHSTMITAKIMGEKYNLFSADVDDFVDHQDKSANCDFVIKAVNNHYQLVEALRIAETRIDSMIKPEDYEGEIDKDLAKIRKALAGLDN